MQEFREKRYTKAHEMAGRLRRMAKRYSVTTTTATQIPRKTSGIQPLIQRRPESNSILIDHISLIKQNDG